MSKINIKKPMNNFPTETRNAETIAKRVKGDLTWVVISAALSLAAAAAVYMLIKPA